MTISLYLSGDGTSPAKSIGGAKSAVAVTYGLMGKPTANHFDEGRVWYRIIYVQTSTAQESLLVSVEETPSAATTVALAWLGAVNTLATALASETTAPSGATFSTPEQSAAGVDGGVFAAGQWRALCIRYTINAGTEPINLEEFALNFTGTETMTLDGDPMTLDGEPMELT